jgi:hypothetical protein
MPSFVKITTLFKIKEIHFFLSKMPENGIGTKTCTASGNIFQISHCHNIKAKKISILSILYKIQ